MLMMELRDGDEVPPGADTATLTASVSSIKWFMFHAFAMKVCGKDDTEIFTRTKCRGFPLGIPYKWAGIPNRNSH
jgi:hypothetical protein